jgi:hypothetical protein
MECLFLSWLTLTLGFELMSVWSLDECPLYHIVSQFLWTHSLGDRSDGPIVLDSAVLSGNGQPQLGTQTSTVGQKGAVRSQASSTLEHVPMSGVVLPGICPTFLCGGVFSRNHYLVTVKTKKYCAFLPRG